TEADLELMDRKGGICPTCNIRVPYEPAPSEIRAMKAEATIKYLKLFKRVMADGSECVASPWPVRRGLPGHSPLRGAQGWLSGQQPRPLQIREHAYGVADGSLLLLQELMFDTSGDDISVRALYIMRVLRVTQLLEVGLGLSTIQLLELFTQIEPCLVFSTSRAGCIPLSLDSHMVLSTARSGCIPLSLDSHIVLSTSRSGCIPLRLDSHIVLSKARAGKIPLSLNSHIVLSTSRSGCITLSLDSHIVLSTARSGCIPPSLDSQIVLSKSRAGCIPLSLASHIVLSKLRARCIPLSLYSHIVLSKSKAGCIPLSLDSHMVLSKSRAGCTS
ncbi:hypothetical protein PoB_007711800, partial [Plakobranchus ocellatus]